MIELTRNSTAEDYAEIYKLNPGDIFKIRADVEFETVYYNICTHYLPNDDHDIDIIYIPVGHPEYANYGPGHCFIVNNSPVLE